MGRKRYILPKRVFDVTFSLLVIVLILSWLTPIVAIIIFLESGERIFFTQKRVGKNGKSFKIYKFKSMRGKSPLNDPLLSIDEAKRITKFGHLLRKYRIDEFPQFFNVLKGEMSLVGPRPPLAEEVNQYEKSETRRLLVKPGLTGLWQVSGRSELDWEDAVRLDLYYVENWSLTLDILIIIRTAAAVWRGEGAY